MVDTIAFEIYYNLGLFDSPYPENMYFICELFALFLMFAVVLVPVLFVYYIIKRFMGD